MSVPTWEKQKHNCTDERPEVTSNCPCLDGSNEATPEHHRQHTHNAKGWTPAKVKN